MGSGDLSWLNACIDQTHFVGECFTRATTDDRLGRTAIMSMIDTLATEIRGEWFSTADWQNAILIHNSTAGNWYSPGKFQIAAMSTDFVVPWVLALFACSFFQTEPRDVSISRAARTRMASAPRAIGVSRRGKNR